MINAVYRIWTLAITIIVAAMSSVAWAKTDSSLNNDNLKTTGHRAFRAGEDLTFTVKYGFVKGGEGHFFVTDTVINGRHAEHITISGRTTGLADAIFEVRDTYESFMDKQTQLPLVSIRNIKEGKYRYFDRTTYDNNEGTVSIHKETRRGEKDTTEFVGRNMLDIVSAFYFARNNSFNNTMSIGDTISFNTYFGGQIFPLRIRYQGTEKVKTKLGKVLCYKFAPVTEVGRTFKSKDDMHLWITADDNRLPVKIEFKMLVGSFSCELTSCKGLAHEVSYAN
ncbi:MAG: DUF3108 domain-containing protein [Bacteroidales bacterium]|nr:DUF3108 domain-containing protein [Bacteroidales bacterium]